MRLMTLLDFFRPSKWTKPVNMKSFGIRSSVPKREAIKDDAWWRKAMNG